MSRPKVLIEEWLPIEAIGAEGKRERGASSALPPLYFLHVWWARRPLIASRAAILGSVLPVWSEKWPEHLLKLFPNQEKYQDWFIHLIGIRGDPVKGRKLIDWAKAKGIRLKFHPYGGAPRAFTVNPSQEDLDIMKNLLKITWGEKDITVLDSFAGGGSIPFEALRYGFTTIANELNPVAATILKGTLDYPARFGPELAEDIEKWGNLWAARVEEKLSPYFPKQDNENIFAYLWARTVACPTTGKPVPLSPNWWLSKKKPEAAVQIIAEEGMDAPQFKILTGDQVKIIDPDEGTVSRGVGKSPWTGETIPGDYIKSEAQAGRMGEMLYAIAVKSSEGFIFRVPSNEDLSAISQVKQDLSIKKIEWLTKDLIPDEKFPEGNDNRPINYGMPFWVDFYSPRQLLSMGYFMETLKEIEKEIKHSEEVNKAKAIITYLGFIIDKVSVYNCRTSRWHSGRNVMAPQFERHDFSFKWSHGEFDSSANLLTWAIEQITDAYKGISEISAPSQVSFVESIESLAFDRLEILNVSAMALNEISDKTIENVTIDPPYYDNVQYAELSDFFYVWLKRSVGHLYPHFFKSELTNKDDEAVASPARFSGLGRNRKKLAEQDYERKMTSSFKEIFRILTDDGTLSVMFTHKQVEAWDTLASSLINGGFSINSSWPIHTESEHSLHQAKKNAAASTILLSCRKRESFDREPVWWDDIKNTVRQTARETAIEFSKMGISGVDLYISTFGPTLSIISEKWPVLTSEVDPKTGEPQTLRPEIALDLAREEVVRLRKQGLLLGRDIQFDQVTDWYLMAWDAFSAEQFPFDEARKLAIAVGVDMDHILSSKNMARKKGKYIVLKKPSQRRKRGMVDSEVNTFEHWIDAVHTTMMVYEEDGAGACEVFLMRSGLRNDSTFKACLQAMINAIPRRRIKGQFIRKEAETLDNLRLAFFEDLVVPEEEDLSTETPPSQMALDFDETDDEEEEEDSDDE